MKTTQTNSRKQEQNLPGKKQPSFGNADIGSPKSPLRKGQKKQQCEALSDWIHAS